MNKKSTLIWTGIAVALFIFIFFFERHWDSSNRSQQSTERLLNGFKPELTTELRITINKSFIRLQKSSSEDSWWIVSPIHYPAQPVIVGNLLKEIGEITKQNLVDSMDWKKFGLDNPPITIFIKQDNYQGELHIGNYTPDGSGVYVRLMGGDKIYVARAELRQNIPESLNGWRSKALIFTPKSASFDRVEVRLPGGISRPGTSFGFGIQYNPTNKTWRLFKPLNVRAEKTKVENLLMKLLSCRITDFVSEEPREDLEKFGLLMPEVELVIGNGTNDIVTIQFGKSPSNDPTQVYTYIPEYKSVVLVNKEFVDMLKIPFTELRERRLLTFVPETITEISFRGVSPFTLQFQTNQWKILEPQEMVGDLTLISALVSDLLSIQAVEFEKDVVTDYSQYGLAQPLRQVIIKAPVTNEGIVTNIVVAQLDFGTNGAGKFYARRPDENSVYAIKADDYYKLPVEGWQLRSRLLWNIDVTNVVRVTVSKQGLAYQVLRRGDKDWVIGPGSQAVINKIGVDRTIIKLCSLQANSWVARGLENKTNYGFTDDGYKITIDYRKDNALQTVVLEIGGQTKSLSLYGGTNLDGQFWIFELPWIVADDILKNLPPPQQVIPGG